MKTSGRWQPVSVEDYLRGELVASSRSEYVAGRVYAMVGATNAHNMIALNVAASLHGQLRGRRCSAHASDTKIRLRVANQVRFYYPDVSVVCDPNRLDETWQDHPVAIIEVLSRSTRRLDEGEKLEAWLAAPSLATLIHFEQERMEARVWRRGPDGFSVQDFSRPSDRIELAGIDAGLVLADVYERVDFVPEPDLEAGF